ncbi:hypothetical protein V2J09_020898 [Rumex salicifolius]
MTTSIHYTNAFILFFCALGLYLTTAAQQEFDLKILEKRFEEWLTNNVRHYKDRDEWMFRFGVYQSNLQFIDLMNAQNLSFKLADNQFADMTNDEFKLLYMGNVSSLRSPSQGLNYTEHNRPHKNIPKSVDWRKKGAVTSVKNQGSCVAAVEGMNKIKTGKLISLSEQELVDCDTKGSNQGCGGGYMEEAFKYIRKNGGIATENEYPYIGKNGKCSKTKTKNKVAKITGYRTIPAREERLLQEAVARQPISVAIDADGYAFQLYSGGVFGRFCGRKLNHGVTVVGYGEQGRKYWIVKNSWGKKWGENGYMKLQRDTSDKRGACGINMEALYPVIKTSKK